MILIKNTIIAALVSNQNKLFLKDIHTKSWRRHGLLLDDVILLLFPVWFQMYISIV